MNCQKGINLWNEAKKRIPGGSQLLSKRSELFLPEKWPSYYQKSKGVEIWDLDGNRFIDMSLMGIGACTLGYADDDVDAAVIRAVKAGNMSTLNCPEEVELAKLLCEIHPWAQSVRYARTGGEAMTIAVRIARAHSKKEKIAFCGYHGWHDWYLASNLADDSNLDGHLLAGLDPAGVPRGLIGTAIPFEYNNISQLENIIAEQEIGVIVLEPFRHQNPTKNFLEKVRKIATEIGAVLIFDEITAGWRVVVGGIHLKFGIIPDIAVLGKAISNGYPMAAIIGKREIMEAAQSTFISSTYWTERVGPTAAIATINKMREKNVPAHIDKIGGLIADGWTNLARKHGLEISVLPPNALVTFSFNYEKPLELKTFFTQEMLKRGYIASPSVYVSYSHTEHHVEAYLEAVDEVFGLIKQGLEKKNLKELIEGPICHSGFQRLT